MIIIFLLAFGRYAFYLGEEVIFKSKYVYQEYTFEYLRLLIYITTNNI